MDPHVIARFWAAVDKSGPTPAHRPELGSCWMWRAARSNGSRPWENRYGSLKVDRRSRAAHRLSWEIEYGPIPRGLAVLHKCDNAPCVNPAHLEIGTPVRNMRDAAVRGRTMCKLTDLDALEIHVLSARGESQRAVAARFNIARNSVVNILRGATFHHVFTAVSAWCTAPREESEAA